MTSPTAAQVTSAVRAAEERFGHIDVLVNNAGYGVTGAIEEVSEEEGVVDPMFQTNVYGLIPPPRAPFCRIFASAGSGHIVNFSSIGGLIGGAGWGFYNTTKFAVEGFSEALAGEMKPLGVQGHGDRAGAVRTDFLGRSGKLAEQGNP